VNLNSNNSFNKSNCYEDEISSNLGLRIKNLGKKMGLDKGKKCNQIRNLLNKSQNENYNNFSKDFTIDDYYNSRDQILNVITNENMINSSHKNSKGKQNSNLTIFKKNRRNPLHFGNNLCNSIANKFAKMIPSYFNKKKDIKNVHEKIPPKSTSSTSKNSQIRLAFIRENKISPKFKFQTINQIHCNKKSERVGPSSNENNKSFMEYNPKKFTDNNEKCLKTHSLWKESNHKVQKLLHYNDKVYSLIREKNRYRLNDSSYFGNHE